MLSMFDLGRTFLAAVERSPDATAIVDGKRRLGYASWCEEIARIAGGLTALGLRRGDRLAVILQNRLEMAGVHWACQLAGIVVTPLNWRIKPEELGKDEPVANINAKLVSTASSACVARQSPVWTTPIRRSSRSSPYRCSPHHEKTHRWPSILTRNTQQSLSPQLRFSGHCASEPTVLC
jgi:acyl-CoA synthetase (AMP-forming)/AMP-acid ligase II